VDAPELAGDGMIREDAFVMSHRPYAVKTDDLFVGAGWPSAVPAVWYRRRRGVTVACYGRLWDLQDPRPATVAEFLNAHDDGRYGGHCNARWDGRALWSDGFLSHEDAERVLSSLLRPMLLNFPMVPPGFDGWWTFHTPTER
jgi:hypothetical protein